MIRASSGRKSLPPFAELALSLEGAVLAKTFANSPSAITFRVMQVKRATGFMIADALRRAAPARRAAGTENRGFSSLDGRELCFDVRFSGTSDCFAFPNNTGTLGRNGTDLFGEVNGAFAVSRGGECL
jgi:uncharacterized membrane protein